MPVLKQIKAPNGFTIVPVHYSHDPERDLDWVQREKSKYNPQVWNREQEIDFREIVGSPVYPSWSDQIHIVEGVELVPGVPICVACDFNVDPCIWEICQIVRGSYLHIVDEIALGPADIDDMVKEFRNRYPVHSAPIIWYGDATGNSRSVQSKMGCWDLIRLHMGGYPCPVEYRVGKVNPSVRDRVSAVAARLEDTNGKTWVRVNPRCEELIADGNEVVWDTKRRGTTTAMRELQVYDRDNPYHRRTHAFSAVGYLIYREWPIGQAIDKAKPRRRPPERKYGRLLGEI